MKYSTIPSKRGSSLDYVYESEPYRQLTEAVRKNDVSRAGAIVAGQVAVTDGEERFMWLGIQVSSRLRYAVTPRQKLEHWPAIVALAREAGDDPDRQRTAVGHAFVVLLETERIGDLALFCLPLRPGYAIYQREGWNYYFNRAQIHNLNGRWGRAHRAFSRSLEAFRQMPEAKLSAMLGYVVGLFAERSICAGRLGRIDWAEQDLREAVATREAIKSEPTWATCLAEAELALRSEEFSRARSMLQAADMRLKSSGTPLYPRMQVRMELLAARIARAEGNMASFRYFGSRALAVAREHDLALSEAEARRILDGAAH